MSGEAPDPTAEDKVRAAEYLLDLLPAEDHHAFEARLTREPALRMLVAGWADDFVAMTDAIAEVEVPPHVWEALRGRLWQEEPAPRGLRGFIASLGIGELVIGTAAAAALAFLAWETGLMTPAELPDFQASIGTEADAARYIAAFDPDSGQLSLDRLGEAAPSGSSHELWLIAGDGAPISLLVWPAGSARQVIDLPPPLARQAPGATLAISLEPAGGSPAAGPTGPVLAAAPLAEVRS
ncbi:MAG: hypothetical protein GYB53_08030 [Rhodobacteraceae bacterium]|nr:hypothetical protein [Paracoccaceae bacterium]MBR9819517.1 hypothetical protein [Paracoccaceae bacterium]